MVWDFIGDGTSKLYASAGRFYYALPTDLNVRVFSANSQLFTYNYSPTDLNQGARMRRATHLFQGGSPTGEPVDAGMKAAYQDELTLGVEKAIDPTLSVGIKGTYRTLGRTVEDRCDLDYNDPLSQGSTCALFNPGSDGVAASGGIASCNGSANPTDPNAGQCGLPGVAVGDAKRIFRGIELTARKQFTNTLWAQASFLYLVAARQLLGRHPRGLRPDGPRDQRRLRLLPVQLQRVRQARARPARPGPHRHGVQRAVRPLGRTAVLRPQRPADLPARASSTTSTRTSCILSQRGSNGRTPTDYDMNVSLGYNVNLGPVTVTPQLYLYNVFNRQTATSVDGTGSTRPAAS